MRSLFLLFCASCASLRPSLPILFASFACFAGHLAAQPANVQADPTTGALFRPAAATFISGNSLLTTSAAAAAYQPLDADLTAIAALTTASYGRSLLTLADAAALRTSAALVIGTDVQAFDAELAAISGISANGLIARTSASTAAARTITGTAGQITVTNGDGVSGNPTLALPTALTSVNSVTSAAASNLTLGTGTFGTALTFTSATGAATFAGSVTAGAGGTSEGIQVNTNGLRINLGPAGNNIASNLTNDGAWKYVANGFGSVTALNASGDFQWYSAPSGVAAATATLTLRASLTNSGVFSIPGTTASTSTTTGSLVNAGGFGNAGAAYIGGIVHGHAGQSVQSVIGSLTPSFFSGHANGTTSNVLMSGNTTRCMGIQAYTDGSNTGYWSLGFQGNPTFVEGLRVFAGLAGVGVGVVSIPSTTASTSTTTGSLINAGGFGNAGAIFAGGQIRSTSATGGIGYATGAGGAVTQGTSRTTGVTLNNVCGAITLFTAAGSVTWQSFTVTNSTVAATDTIIVNQRSGTDLYMMSVTAVGAGSFRISFATTGGTTSEAPVFNFSVIKAVSS
jgi:hypothetical protein